jgi:hypothetical protein
MAEHQFWRDRSAARHKVVRPKAALPKLARHKAAWHKGGWASVVLVAAAAWGGEWQPIPLIQDGQVAPEWKQVGFGQMVVANGALRTEPDERGLGLWVYTARPLGHCQVRIVYRPENSRSNAGVFVRIDQGILDWIGRDSPAVRRDARGRLPAEMRERMRAAAEAEQGAWYAVHHGYEVQIMDAGGDPLHRTGAIYSLAPAAELPPPAADGWRTMVITLDGPKILVEIDGRPITRFDASATDLPPRKQWYEPKREAARPEVGYLGLQTHDPGDVVYFREVSVRPLP